MERDHYSYLLQTSGNASFILNASQKLLQGFKNQQRIFSQFLRLIALAVLIVGCGQDKKEEKASSMRAESTHEKQKQEIAVGDFESNFTKAEIAKFTIASIMNKKPETLKVEERGGIMYVASKNPENGKTTEYKIRINGNRINWGNVPGRWRTTKKDEKISFEENGDNIIIVQTFEDGSRITKAFGR